MHDEEFRALLNLLMCSDPWPTGDIKDRVEIEGLLARESRKRGFTGWIEAYHKFKIKEIV